MQVIIDNDATTCFDQMIQAPNNPACLQHRANAKCIQLHAQTQHNSIIIWNTNMGISTGFNTNQVNQPWYGMGQGACDACNQWDLIVWPMLTWKEPMAGLYPPHSPTNKSHNIGKHSKMMWTFLSENPKQLQKMSSPRNVPIQYKPMAWASLDNRQWTQHQEMFWSYFQLQYDLNSTLSLWTKTQDYPQLYLTNCDNTRETLKTTESERGRCHLRLHISMDGNSKTETQILFKRCKMFQKVYSNSMSMKFITYKNKLLCPNNHVFFSTAHWNSMRMNANSIEKWSGFSGK